MKIKKDRIFVIVLGIILVNLVYYFSGMVTLLPANINRPWHWSLVIANGIAIGGCLWLLRSYRHMIKESKKNEISE